MSNKYLFPQKIYLDSDETLNKVAEYFKLENIDNKRLKIGEWLLIKDLKIKEEEKLLFKGCKIIDKLKKINQTPKEEFINNKTEYIVKPMDTFYTVSKKLNISETYLREIARTKYLYVGQKLEIYI